MAFEFTQLEPSIVRCRHTGPVTHEDRRQLAAFLKSTDSFLLIDLSGTPSFEMAQQLCSVRSRLPVTALYGPPLPRFVLDALPGKDFYMHPMRYFPTQETALNWLRDQQVASQVIV